MLVLKWMRWTEHVTSRRSENSSNIFVGNPEGKKPYVRLKCRKRIILKLVLKLGCEGVGWIK
jgi:hypothetical protein